MNCDSRRVLPAQEPTAQGNKIMQIIREKIFVKARTYKAELTMSISRQEETTTTAFWEQQQNLLRVVVAWAHGGI